MNGIFCPDQLYLDQEEWGKDSELHLKSLSRVFMSSVSFDDKSFGLWWEWAFGEENSLSPPFVILEVMDLFTCETWKVCLVLPIPVGRQWPLKVNLFRGWLLIIVQTENATYLFGRQTHLLPQPLLSAQCQGSKIELPLIRTLPPFSSPFFHGALADFPRRLFLLSPCRRELRVYENLLLPQTDEVLFHRIPLPNHAFAPSARRLRVTCCLDDWWCFTYLQQLHVMHQHRTVRVYNYPQLFDPDHYCPFNHDPKVILDPHTGQVLLRMISWHSCMTRFSLLLVLLRDVSSYPDFLDVPRLLFCHSTLSPLSTPLCTPRFRVRFTLSVVWLFINSIQVFPDGHCVRLISRTHLFDPSAPTTTWQHWSPLNLLRHRQCDLSANLLTPFQLIGWLSPRFMFIAPSTVITYLCLYFSYGDKGPLIFLRFLVRRTLLPLLPNQKKRSTPLLLHRTDDDDSDKKFDSDLDKRMKL